VLDAERPRALDEPVHGGAVEGAGAAETVGPREPGQELHVDFLREPAERAVGDDRRLVEHPRLEMLGDQSNHVPPHVVTVDRMHVQTIEQADGRLDAGFLVVRRPDLAVDERGGRRLAEVVAQRA
jgi:hypothetical protein